MPADEPAEKWIHVYVNLTFAMLRIGHGELCGISRAAGVDRLNEICEGFPQVSLTDCNHSTRVKVL